MNLIYKDYCKTPITIRQITEIMKIKQSMLGPNNRLVNYLKDKSEDNGNDNGTVAAERMQHQANDKVNALQRISKLPAATDIKNGMH